MTTYGPKLSARITRDHDKMQVTAVNIVRRLQNSIRDLQALQQRLQKLSAQDLSPDDQARVAGQEATAHDAACHVAHAVLLAEQLTHGVMPEPQTTA